MAHYCRRGAKQIYCDKSLDSVLSLEAVRMIFPEARYLLLFRHVMDTVASGLEASPWGFQGYGYLPFVQRSPHNFVAALVDCWLTHVDAALQWEEAHPSACHRVRYEDLVTNPEQTLSSLFAFLDVQPDLSVVRAAFEKTATAGGHGDYKVRFTSSIHGSSIGRGKRVPVRMIPLPQLELVNEKLTRLGYDSLSTAWNVEPIAKSSERSGPWGMWLADQMRTLRVTPPQGRDGTIGSFALIAEDVEELRWVIDPASGVVHQGNGDVEMVVTGTAEDLALMLSDEVNPGVLLRSGRIRHLTARDDVSPQEVVDEMLSILTLLRKRHCGS
jgi:hypothetical protein